VAALADRHVVVSKEVVGDTTITKVTMAAGDERVHEVARMLSGDQVGESARVHAADLLAQRPDRSRS